MKPFLVHWHTNYGSAALVINADNAQEALELALAIEAWENAEVIEIDLNTPGVVAGVEPTG